MCPIGSMNMENLPGAPVDWDELFSLPKDYWLADVEETRKYFHDQVGTDMPKKVLEELDKQEELLKKLWASQDELTPANDAALKPWHVNNDYRSDIRSNLANYTPNPFTDHRSSTR